MYNNICFFSEKHLKFHSLRLNGLHEKDYAKNRFHVSSGNPSAGSILISFVLGCAGFFLLILVLTMVIVTLAREEQIHITSDAELKVEDCQDLIDGEVIEEEAEIHKKCSWHLNSLMVCPLKIVKIFLKIIVLPFQVLRSLFISNPLHYIEVI